MTTMAKMNDLKIVVRSRGFAVWKQYEAVHGRTPMETIAEETNLGMSTVRKYIAEPDADVSTAACAGAAVLARYFGETLCTFLYVEEKGGAECNS